jgi:hypothetical protein
VNHTITVPEGAYALNVTLTWTDPPGAPLVNGLDMVNMTNPEDGNRTLGDTVVPRQLVNDLDLEAHGPNGNTYPGNRGLDNDADSDKGHRSIHADRANNIENVFVDTDKYSSEEWTIQVHGSQVQMPAIAEDARYGQSYGLVIQPITDPDYTSTNDDEDGGGCSCDSTYLPQPS